MVIHLRSIHTQYTACFHVYLSVYNVFIVHPKEQCGNVNQATQMYHYNAEDRNVCKLTAKNKTNFVGVKLSVLVIDAYRKYIMYFLLL